MPRAVGDEGDELLGVTFGVAQEAVGDLHQQVDEVDVAPLIEAPDVVGVGGLPLVEDQVNGACVVFDEEPVADVLSLAVDGQGLALADVVDEEGDELLGELVRAVVIRAVRHDGRQAVGVVVGTDEVVAGGFAGRVGAVRSVLRLLGEEAPADLQCAVDFVGGDVVEALPLKALGRSTPRHAGSFE